MTVNPYLGRDSLIPFFDYSDRGVFVICLTSNKGVEDFQLPELYLKVGKKVKEWNIAGNAGLVVGATRYECISKLRKVCGNMPFLIPGVGAQGGDLEKTLFSAEDGTKIPYLINASRTILYASSKDDFGVKAARAAKELRDKINLSRLSL